MTDPQKRPPVRQPSTSPAPQNEEPVRLRTTFRNSEAEVDMTPMVDVTFLLLIFFMVTAAFSLQKSFKVPSPDDSRPSSETRPLEDIEDDPRFVIVRIDRYNTFHVVTAAWETEREAPSEQDLLIKLREARAARLAGEAPTNLLVAANGECRHERVVTALDAGIAVGMERVQFIAVEEDESW